MCEEDIEKKRYLVGIWTIGHIIITLNTYLIIINWQTRFLVSSMATFYIHYLICDWWKMPIVSAAYMAWIGVGLATVHARLDSNNRKKNNKKYKQNDPDCG